MPFAPTSLCISALSGARTLWARTGPSTTASSARAGTWSGDGRESTTSETRAPRVPSKPQPLYTDPACAPSLPRNNYDAIDCKINFQSYWNPSSDLQTHSVNLCTACSFCLQFVILACCFAHRMIFRLLLRMLLAVLKPSVVCRSFVSTNRLLICVCAFGLSSDS